MRIGAVARNAVEWWQVAACAAQFQSMARCGAPTKKGGPCSFDEAECPHHQGWRERRDRETSSQPGQPRRKVKPPAGILEGRDLRELGWWLISAVLRGGLDERQASITASVMRVLSALGPGDSLLAEDDEEYRLQVRLAFGLPPLDEAGWELARTVLDPQTLKEVQRWHEPSGRRRLEPPDEPV